VAMGDYPAAENLLKRTLAGDPDNLAAYSTLAVVFAHQGQLPAAQHEFEMLAQKDPKAVWPRTMVAVLLQLQGQMPAAEKAYEQALQIDPTAPVAANNLAYIYTLRSDKLDMALQLAQAAKRKLPDEPEITDTLGWIYYKKGLYSLSIPLLLQTVEKQPKNPDYLFHLGSAYIKSGEQEKGRAMLERALAAGTPFHDSDEAKRLLASLQAPGVKQP